MGSITIGDLSDGLLQRLNTRAAAKGQSVEQAALEILSGALPGSAEAAPDYPGSGKEAYERIRAIYAPLGGRNIEPPSRRCCEHICSVNRQP